MSAKLEIAESENDTFLFNLKAGNGEVIHTPYFQLEAALRMARSSVTARCTPRPRRWRTGSHPFGVMHLPLRSSM